MGSIKEKRNATQTGQNTHPREGAWKNVGQQFQKDALSFVKFNGQQKKMPILGKQNKAKGIPVPTAAPAKPAKNGPKMPGKAPKPAKATPPKPAPAPKAVQPVAAVIPAADENAAANLQDSDAVLAQILEQKRVLDEQIATLLAMKSKPAAP